MCLPHESSACTHSTYLALNSPIFLSPFAKNLWCGDCTQTQVCTATNPCKPSTTTTVSGSCDIIFASASYASLSKLSFSSDSSGDFQVLINGTVEDLDLILTNKAPKVQSTDTTLLSTLIRSTIHVSVTQKLSIFLSRLNLVDSFLFARADWGTSWMLKDCAIRISKGSTTKSFISLQSPEPAASPPTKHSFSFDTIIGDLSFNVLVTTNNDIALAMISNSKIDRALHAFNLLGSASIGAMQVGSSSFTNISDSFISFELASPSSSISVPAPIPTLSMTNVNLTGAPTVTNTLTATGALTASLPRLFTRPSNLILDTVLISDMNVNCKTNSWRDSAQGPLLGNILWLTNTRLHNCGSCWGGHPQLKSSSFTYQSDDKAGVYTYFSLISSNFENVSFTAFATNPESPFSATVNRVIFDTAISILSPSSITSNATMFVKSGTAVSLRDLDITGTVNLEDKTSFSGIASNWTLRYPVTFQSVDMASGGTFPTSKVVLTYLESINLVMSRDFLGNPLASVITADPSISIEIEGTLMYKQFHVDWSSSLGAPASGGYQIGHFTLHKNGYPNLFSANCTHLIGDKYRFFGVSTMINPDRSIYRSTFTQGELPPTPMPRR